jgi:hypothetical protein
VFRNDDKKDYPVGVVSSLDLWAILAHLCFAPSLNAAWHLAKG